MERATCLALLKIALLASMIAAAEANKPNFLILYTDDHGWADFGLHGSDSDIRTPHLDRLAQEGVRFSRGYVTAPQCVPSRAGLLTGRHQNRFGVDDNLSGPLPLEQVTIAERLKRAGYVTGQVGKWHLNVAHGPGRTRQAKQSREHLPHAQGFDEYWCGSRGSYHASHDLSGRPLESPPQVIQDRRFRITVQTEAALSFLDRRAGRSEQPWLLYLAWFAPHVPLESPEPWFSQTPAQLPLQRRQALAMIRAMDDGLGRIRQKLKDMGQEQNTLIFFISDNGAPLRPGAWDGSLNKPLIGEKGMLTDGGIRVPFVAAWPGRIPSGKVFSHPVWSLDVAATLNAAAGLKPDPLLEGVNLLPHLTGENSKAPHAQLFWRWRTQAAILEHPWKLIRLGAQQRYLFNVSEPSGEKHDLAAQHPERVARLEQQLLAWSQSLPTSGLPTSVQSQDGQFFRDHVDGRLPQVATPAPAAGSAQGWLCRNGRMAVQENGLQIQPSSNAKGRTFITHSRLSIPGPIKLRIRIRCESGGELSCAWRESQQRDFPAGQQARVSFKAAEEWQELELALPVKTHLQHIRIVPPQGQACQIRSISISGAKGAGSEFTF